MTTTIHRLALRLKFPEGISPGEGRSANLLGIARMGPPEEGKNSCAVLRGSAFAGVLRHEWEKHHGDASKWFGEPLDGQTYQASPLKVPDVPLLHENSGQLLRTHIAVNRHTGAVLEKGLFSLESLPPGTHCDCCLWLHTDDHDFKKEEVKAFFETLLHFLDNGITLGGNSARGIGRAELSKTALYQTYDLRDPKARTAWMDEDYAWRKDRTLPKDGDELAPATPDTSNDFHLKLTLCVPGAEDFLIADGQGMDYEMEPQRVKGADGQNYFRIPGSSLRGVFRSWFNRLASRAGHPVSDPVTTAQNTTLAGKDLAWLGKSATEVEEVQERLSKAECHGYSTMRQCLQKELPYPVDELFGSAFAKGRIHISDALAPEDLSRIQPRKHVAIDRFTGGANEGFLFDNQVLVRGPVFPFRIRIESPTVQEIKWLISTLRALDYGVLRVGSSKAGGRLGVKNLKCQGRHAAEFNAAWEETKP
ncbi:MAG: hypothetical protein JJU29_12685 [Verrucomicrobia bacterium]|nr:hypothetical protein [Verrucomicrobiota bacterium]MCH8512647.1 RAMP superfamily CRISPR-associated protein [Kiritimatiellia bacterium]